MDSDRYTPEAVKRFIGLMERQLGLQVLWTRWGDDAVTLGVRQGMRVGTMRFPLETTHAEIVPADRLSLRGSPR